MFTAVLQQINCHAEYKAGYLRRQVAWYLAKHAHIFAAMAPLQNDDTFESYVWDIFKGYRCGDECPGSHIQDVELINFPDWARDGCTEKDMPHKDHPRHVADQE